MCSSCGRVAADEAELARHRLSAHPPAAAPERTSCARGCGFATVSRLGLARHERRPHDAKCTHCDFEAICDKRLARHVKKGHAKRPRRRGKP